MPSIAGVYFSETEEHVGAGGTRKTVVLRVHWFVVVLDDGRYVVQPLNAENLPGGFKRLISRDDFLADYAPDPGHFNSHVKPVLHGLAAKLGGDAERADPGLLDAAERLVFKALHIDGLSGRTAPSGPEALHAVRGLLATIPVMEETQFAFQSAVNAKSIELRKEGDYERSIRYYLKALRIDPDDDHLHFNLARAYWHNGERDKCARQLARALELNPGFSEAHRFMEFVERRQRKLRGNAAPFPVEGAAAGAVFEVELDSADPVADLPPELDLRDVDEAADEWDIERRRSPRVVLDVDAWCVMLAGGRECRARVRDLSLHGARLELCGDDAPAAKAGERVMLMEHPGPLAELLRMRKGLVVWREGTLLGVNFNAPIDTEGRDLAGLLAPA